MMLFLVMGAMCAILAIGCIVSDTIMPKFSRLEAWFERLERIKEEN